QNSTSTTTSTTTTTTPTTTAAGGGGLPDGSNGSIGVVGGVGGIGGGSRIMNDTSFGTTGTAAAAASSSAGRKYAHTVRSSTSSLLSLGRQKTEPPVVILPHYNSPYEAMYYNQP
ncbi:hypothetical protein BGZ65_011110, partial [Modicella reniformis]